VNYTDGHGGNEIMTYFDDSNRIKRQLTLFYYFGYILVLGFSQELD